MTFNLPETESTGTINPNIWPMIILLVMLLMGILLAIRTFRENKNNQHNKEQEQSEVANPHYHWLIMIVLVGYVLFMPVIGFF